MRLSALLLWLVAGAAYWIGWNIDHVSGPPDAWETPLLYAERLKRNLLVALIGGTVAALCGTFLIIAHRVWKTLK